jgi:hypothetical protein
MKLDHISHSQISTLSKCGEQYRRRYVEGEKLPPGFAQIRGGAVHYPIEKNMLHKMETGELLSLDEVRQLAADAIDSRLAGEIRLDGDYTERGLAAARGLVKDEVVQLAGLHATKVAPSIVPTAIEVRIEVPPSAALPVTLVGILDLIDGGDRIRDTKTKQKSPSEGDADLSDQLTAYDLLFRALYGQAPKDLVLDHLVRTPGRGELKVVSQATTRSISDLGVYLRRVEAAVRAVDAEIFLPAPQDSWSCSERHCGYATSCLFFRGRPRPQS